MLSHSEACNSLFDSSQEQFSCLILEPDKTKFLGHTKSNSKTTKAGLQQLSKMNLLESEMKLIIYLNTLAPNGLNQVVYARHHVLWLYAIIIYFIAIIMKHTSENTQFNKSIYKKVIMLCLCQHCTSLPMRYSDLVWAPANVVTHLWLKTNQC